MISTKRTVSVYLGVAFVFGFAVLSGMVSFKMVLWIEYTSQSRPTSLKEESQQ